MKKWISSLKDWLSKRSKLDRVLIIVSCLVVVLFFLVIILAILDMKMPDTKEHSTTPTIKDTTHSTTTTVTPTKATTTQAPVYHFFHPLTGMGLMDDEAQLIRERRPLLVVYDNHHDAWPQAGISKADLLIEMLAEGRITRLMGLFYGDMPEKFGPIRSARPYLIVKSQEFDAFFAHVGGSQAALADIYELGVADLDGMKSGAFNRYPPKYPPHNTYAYYSDLMEEAENYGYRLVSSPKFFAFDPNTDYTRDWENAATIRFDYRDGSYYDDPGYQVSYHYDKEQNTYIRHVNGEPQRDELDEQQIVVSNIIVQYCYHEVLDDEGRLAIDLYSGGAGYLFRDGKVHEIHWSKNGLEQPTQYWIDGEEDPIVLSPGKTAIHTVYEGILEYEE